MTNMKKLRNVVSDTRLPKGTLAGSAMPVRMVKNPMMGNTVAGPANPVKRRR